MFTNIVFKIIDTLFPKKVPEKTYEEILKEFRIKLRTSHRHSGLQNTKTNQPPAVHIHILYVYRDPTIKKAILDIKRGNQSVSYKALQVVTLEYIQKVVRGHTCILCSVPSSAHALKLKKFDHMELFLDDDSLHDVIPLRYAIRLHTEKITASQHALSKQERILHAQNKFYISEEFKEKIIEHVKIHGLVHILYIDDVTTTGATFSALCKLTIDFIKMATYTNTRVQIDCVAIAG
jgi:predicted amidophosphoribosyltransferase